MVASLTADGTSVSSSTAYDPFGKQTATTGTTPAVGYQSGWTDPESGDVNMAARWYQPGTGSFASRDTWQLDPFPSAQANRYTYVNAAPLNGTDPSGHLVLKDSWGGVGLATGEIYMPRGPIKLPDIRRPIPRKVPDGKANRYPQRSRGLPGRSGGTSWSIGSGPGITAGSLADALGK
ncbi:RHS repeat-associated core domain-containing protein [Streptomyces sp. SAS_267]|uniref:RHS repeat-associated core domain-containing protein n=1 Tax=unclassified Streptomyces TaxID=2593676 RepID=UPI0036F5A88D